MSFSRFIIGYLIVFSINALSILPSDLVFTPYSEFPEFGQTEFGYQLSYHTIDATTYDKGFYFNHSISKNIRFGTEYYENGDQQKIYHHFAYRMGQLFKDSRYHLIFSGAVNYLSSSVPTLVSERVYDGSFTTSWKPNNQPIRIHYTVAREIGSEEYISLGALSYQQDWGHFSIEWDGDHLNLSNQFHINERLNIRSGITKDTKNNSDLILKFAIGFIDFLPIFNPDGISNDELADDKIETVDTSIGLKHIQEGLEFFYNGEYRKAQKSYEIAVKLFPESGIVHERLGSIYFKLGEYDKAKYQWEKANILTPSPRLERYIRDAKEKGESLYE